MGEGWVEAVDAWVDYQRAAGSPATTVAVRRYHVLHAARDLALEPSEVSVDLLTTWLGSKVWSPNTRRSYRASLRAFYAWALDTGRVGSSPAQRLPAVRVPRAKPRPVSEPEFRAALLQARAAGDDRLRLALLLGGVCGLRRSEVARARREDSEPDLLGQTLRVVGKGGHVRMVPLTAELTELIEVAPPGWLFPSPRSGHLTPHHLGKLVTAALPPGKTMHMLRHRCATVAYAATHDLRAVQELLGHASPDTTAIYTQVPGEAIRAAMESAA